MRVLIASALLALAVTTPTVGAPKPSGADGVVNGSFEVPDAPAGSYTVFNGGQQFTGWAVTGTQVAIVDGTFVSGEFRFPAATGEQWLDLSGETATNGAVTQSLSLAPSRRHTLSWAVGNVSGGSFGTESSVRVLIDGDPVTTVTNSQPGTTMNWEVFTHTFTPTSSPTVIEFRNADPAGDNSNGLDRIRIIAGAATPPQPTLGETANAETVSGEVLVRLQKGGDFVPLEEARAIPIGALVDTTNGTVSLTTARNAAGDTQSGQFGAGLFQVLQSRKRRAKGVTELRMKGSTAAFNRCTGGRRRAISSALSRRAIRRLRASARGRFRTRGRHSAATVRGTKWIVEDRCDGTLTKVKRGRVAVRDFRRKKTIVLSAGKSYVARASGG